MVKNDPRTGYLEVSFTHLGNCGRRTRVRVQGSRVLIWMLLSVSCCETSTCERQEGSFISELGTQ